ncbi:helix-turn-helix domain-containing protein [Peribacillus sp. NPDC097675]|uniref:helix-turn-helix domain-containing protein n=1 Tax=Peribacillus sp. NPDC097675 TaxID=3390618 RepID=UPI003D0461A8
MDTFNFKNLGAAIYELRLKLNISQSELAKGICSQSQISKIEKGVISPYIDTLMNISKKLGVDQYYFINLISKEHYEFIKDFKSSVRSMIKKKDYKEVRRLVNKYKKHPVMQNIEEQQFIKWHLGICAYYLENDFNKSIQLLTETLEMDHTIHATEQNLHILNSIAVIYSEIEIWEQSKKYYSKAWEVFHTSIYPMNIQILIKLCYNLGKTLYKLALYDEALVKIRKGIHSTKEAETNYLFGELFYQEGLVLIKLNMYEKASISFNQAASVFSLVDKESFLKVANDKLNYCKKFLS